MTQQENKQEAECYLLKTQSGQWKFEIHEDGDEVAAGVGYEDEWEAMEAAQEQFGTRYTLRMVVRK